MHIIIAQMSHETNTYSPVISDLARFHLAAMGRLSPVTRHGRCFGVQPAAWVDT